MADLHDQTSTEFASVLKKLEFDKVLERVSRLAVSEGGKRSILDLVPSTNPVFIKGELERVSEAKELLIAEGSVPLEGLKDIRAALKKTTVENQALTIQELLDVASTLHVSRSMHGFLAKRKQLYPALAHFPQQLYSDKIVEYNISQALDEQGFVKDTASKELRAIRQGVIAASEGLRKRLESIMHRISEDEFLQEEIITTRDGRLVIPVKTEFKNRVEGFIHSTSASGATVYIEPTESLELNNTLRELQLREQREIYRILLDLTKQVGDIRQEVEQSQWTLIELDALVAKAKYSIEIVGTAPTLSQTPAIRFTQARHPILLQRHHRENVVPLTLELGGNTTTLIITGPNAGGKTVAMKTVGLLALCTQAGIHIPAASDSLSFPFSQYFVDIGDDQSIENDLSTFSSHLLMVKKVVQETDDRSLVLMDEIGAGTDPAEGGALAATVLDELTHRKAITIATTHHGLLKVFAHQTAGVMNGSMEFDQQSLRPTYRFRSGLPGSSFAFELAERVGIPNRILEQARGQLGDEKTKLESLIVDLEQKAQELANQLDAASAERDRLALLTRSYEQKMTELKRELGTIRKKAVEEARELLKDVQSKIERSVREIRESQAQSEVVKSARKSVLQLADKLRTIDVVEESPTIEEPIVMGDAVRLRDGKEIGEVVDVQGRYAVVVWGNARLRVTANDLVKAKTDRTVTPAPSPHSFQPAAATELDVRGLLGDEAVQQVQSFLDNALAAGLHRVDIIHGKGTGALRKRIAEFLKVYPHVASFRLGEWNEGGTGVTVVELK